MADLTLHQAGPPAGSNPAAVYLASLAPSGRRGMAGRLRQVAGFLGHDDAGTVPWHRIRYEHVAALRVRLQEAGKAPATVNATLAAVRGVARAAFTLGQMDAETYQRILAVKPAKGTRLPAGRGLTSGEIAALIGACAADPGPSGARDAALLAVLYCAGLRRAEVVALNLEDWDADSGELRVRGKGNRERLLYLNNGAADALADWLTVRGDTPGSLFLPVNKGGRIESRRMADQSVYDVLVRRAKQAGVKKPSPHDLRRSFASDLLDSGADVVVVQALMGHANVQTTARYDRRGEEAKKRAIKRLHVPYERRS